MIELSREQIKADEVWSELLQRIIQNHVVASHTKQTLLENKHVKDFCEEARHFVVIVGDIFIHYDTASWYKEPDGAVVRVESITIYDNFMEYESARLKQLHGSGKADIPNIN